MYIHLHICLLVATPPIPWNTELRSVAGLFETKKVLSRRRGSVVILLIMITRTAASLSAGYHRSPNQYVKVRSASLKNTVTPPNPYFQSLNTAILRIYKEIHCIRRYQKATSHTVLSYSYQIGSQTASSWQLS